MPLFSCRIPTLPYAVIVHRGKAEDSPLILTLTTEDGTVLLTQTFASVSDCEAAVDALSQAVRYALHQPMPEPEAERGVLRGP